MAGKSMLPVAQAKNPAIILNLFSLALPSSPTANSVGTTVKISQNVNIFSLFPLPSPWSKPPFPLARIPATAYSLVSLILPSLSRLVTSPLSSQLSWRFLIHQEKKKKKPPTFPVFSYKVLHIRTVPCLTQLLPPSHLLTLPQPYCAL